MGCFGKGGGEERRLVASWSNYAGQDRTVRLVLFGIERRGCGGAVGARVGRGHLGHAPRPAPPHPAGSRLSVDVDVTGVCGEPCDEMDMLSVC